MRCIITTIITAIIIIIIVHLIIVFIIIISSSSCTLGIMSFRSPKRCQLENFHDSRQITCPPPPLIPTDGGFCLVPSPETQKYVGTFHFYQKPLSDGFDNQIKIPVRHRESKNKASIVDLHQFHTSQTYEDTFPLRRKLGCSDPRALHLHC